jgi:MarR family transcriptional regulator, 2-MHQ and catechol-resistance regulon repressor
VKEIDPILVYKKMVCTTHSIQEVIKQLISQYQINHNEFLVLELLYQEGEQPIQKVGKKVFIASSSITYVIDKLEKNGYIQRIPCKEDRRVMYAKITELGTKMMEELYPQYQEKLNMIFADCQEKEMNELAHMLTKVEQNAF